jgi:CHAT domain-containing protein
MGVPKWLRLGRSPSFVAGALGLVLLSPLHDAGPRPLQVEYEQAQQLFLHGYLEASQAAAEKGYKRSRATNSVWAAKFQLLKAEAMVWRGFYENALYILVSNSPPVGDSNEIIEKLTLEGVALTRLQRFSAAHQNLLEAEEICSRKVLTTCGEVPRAMGVLAIEEGQFAKAKDSFSQSLNFARVRGDRWLEATALLNLGAASLQQEHYDEAADWSKSAYRVATSLRAEDLAQRASGNLGWAFFKLGDKVRALELLLEAQDQATTLGNVLFQVRWFTASGDVYWSTGDYARASESYRRALALAKQINSKEDIVNTLEDLAHASIDDGKVEEANGYLRELGQLLKADSNRLDVLDVTLAQARIATARRNDKDAESLFRVVEKDPASQTSMRLEAEHELARLYESEGRNADADRMYRTSLETFEAARAELRNDDSKLPFLANATSVYDDYIHFLVAQHKTDQALALADRSRARTLEQGLGVTSNVRSSANSPLRPGEVARKTNATLLFYWLGERESYLWAITPTKTSLFSLPARSKIEPMVERYRKALLGLSDPIERSNADGVALYQTLVGPARELIRPGSTVVILNDGSLSQLNFETLIASEPAPHYFIEDATLISAPSLQMLASAKPVEQAGKRLLLVGDAISPNPDYPELPKAATEMKQIEQHFPPRDATIFAREGATAGAYLASTPQQFAYIHFVAHGVASRTDPLDSAIILSRSTAQEDSFKLHARDIMQRPLHARLVTISACYGSGTRSYVGEGLVGLAWAFMRAGAHNVIGALWEVSDESTPRLMGSLYQGLEDGKSPGAALRDAKLELLHAKGEFRKPFFWAPLQIYTGL